MAKHNSTGNNNHSVKKALKGYDNKKFIHSSDGRVLRLLAEYLYPKQRFDRKEIKRTIIFFGSARLKSAKDNGENLISNYYDEAQLLSKLISEWSLSLPIKQQFHICTGGGPGIMEAANRGANDAGARSIGLNISLPFEQYPNQFISKDLNFEFHYFFMRKFWFVSLASAVIVFPGGFGTMDELWEILTLRQTRKVTKPLPIFLYGEEYWKKLINFDFMIESGVISANDLKLFTYVNSPEEAFDKLKIELNKIYKLD